MARIDGHDDGAFRLARRPALGGSGFLVEFRGRFATQALGALGLFEQRHQRIGRRERIEIEHDAMSVLRHRTQGEELRIHLRFEIKHDVTYAITVAKCARHALPGAVDALSTSIRPRSRCSSVAAMSAAGKRALTRSGHSITASESARTYSAKPALSHSSEPLAFSSN